MNINIIEENEILIPFVRNESNAFSKRKDDNKSNTMKNMNVVSPYFFEIERILKVIAIIIANYLI